MYFRKAVELVTVTSIVRGPEESGLGWALVEVIKADPTFGTGASVHKLENILRRSKYITVCSIPIRAGRTA
ncbi:hypothetical protein MBOURGENBZM_08480 [Methanoculleus bourgensis]|jgi:hypothetical protein|nr:hypothetical protein MBOURGENBZM_08480 [Methanoculleus bourgensis]